MQKNMSSLIRKLLITCAVGTFSIFFQIYEITSVTYLDRQCYPVTVTILFYNHEHKNINTYNRVKNKLLPRDIRY
jgi:hypothetical protein